MIYKKIKKAICFFMGLGLCISGVACGGTSNDILPTVDFDVYYDIAEGYDEALRVEDTREISDAEYTKYNTVAVDEFGRVTMPADGVKDDKERYVGLFYFLSAGQHKEHSEFFDTTKILAEYGEEVFQSDSPLSPAGGSHFQSEPIYSYYNSKDKWVMYKQMELLIASGIDYLIFDTSNGLCYNDIAVQLYDVLLDLQSQGFKVPKIVYFFVGTSMAEGSDTSGVIGQVRSVYDEFYSNPKYESLWFKPNGKPIMIITKNGYNDLAKPTHKDHDLFDYYDWRFATDIYKPGTDPVNEGVWPWMDWKYPQDVFYYNQEEKTEGIMSVSVGQHPTVRFSDTEGTRGRGWTKDGGNDHENWVKNLNLEQQWDNAIANDAELKYIFLQGWNEWTATKFEMNGTYFTVDTYNNEYSRDIEPSNDPMLKDNAFLLNMRKIREYKMTEAKHYKYDKVTIDYKQVDDPQWDNIRAYQDVVGEATERNAPRFDSAQGFDFVDTTNRNDIKSVKVARDNEYFYFKVECLNDITKKEDKDKSWMNIHINTQNVGVKTDARGYSYVINRDINTDKGLTTISRAKGDNEYEIVGYGNIVVQGNKMVLRVPLAALSLNDRNYDISFKVSDNIQDIISEGFLSFYNTGDCAPAGKLNYRFGY